MKSSKNNSKLQLIDSIILDVQNYLSKSKLNQLQNLDDLELFITLEHTITNQTPSSITKTRIEKLMQILATDILKNTSQNQQKQPQNQQQLIEYANGQIYFDVVKNHGGFLKKSQLKDYNEF